MRYIIYGAGGIGGGIGARLFQQGHDVVLIARGAHLERMRADGLTLRTPDETATLPIEAVGHPSEITFTEDDVVLLGMKSQDTIEALDALRDAAGNIGGDVPVICAQNGVENERMALRRFSRVYGMVVWVPATHLQPGEVLLYSSPILGVVDVGRYPEGVDPLIEQVAADLEGAGFRSEANPKIMRLKYAKLLQNVNNALQALCGMDAPTRPLVQAARAESAAAFEAAGIDFANLDGLMRGRAGLTSREGHIDGQERGGGSTWQSVMRGQGSVESDYLNGEIVLLGALHGVPTPVNRVLQQATAEAVRERRTAGAYTVDELIERSRALGATFE